MNRAEYEDYVGRVEFYLHGLEAVSTGPCPGCHECGLPEDSEDYDYDPHFSWCSCEVCGSALGGNRHPWHAVLDGELVHGTCCSDCVYYMNYGQLDDQTMLEVEAS